MTTQALEKFPTKKIGLNENNMVFGWQSVWLFFSNNKKKKNYNPHTHTHNFYIKQENNQVKRTTKKIPEWCVLINDGERKNFSFPVKQTKKNVLIGKNFIQFNRLKAQNEKKFSVMKYIYKMNIIMENNNKNWQIR